MGTRSMTVVGIGCAAMWMACSSGGSGVGGGTKMFSEGRGGYLMGAPVVMPALDGATKSFPTSVKGQSSNITVTLHAM